MEQTKSVKDKKPPGLAEQMYAAQQRKQRVFTTNVAISWIALLAFLFYLFSGAKLSILAPEPVRRHAGRTDR